MTEAGDGEDGRIKSAIGIGSLLATASATPSASRSPKTAFTKFPSRRRSIENIREHVQRRNARTSERPTCRSIPSPIERRATEKIERGRTCKLGGDELMRVVVRQANFDKIAHKLDRMGDYKPEIVYEDADIVEIDPRDDAAIAKLNAAADCAIRHGDGRTRSAGDRRLPPARREVARRAIRFC